MKETTKLQHYRSDCTDCRQVSGLTTNTSGLLEGSTTFAFCVAIILDLMREDLVWSHGVLVGPASPFGE